MHRALKIVAILSIFTNGVLSDYQLNDVISNFIPTINSMNEKCKNDSAYYLEKLANLELWATEMFDSTSKFPNGFLHGSTYTLGNFDECVEVNVENNHFNGKYCIAKLDVKILNNHDNYTSTAWRKIAISARDRNRFNRNEIYLSFCIPSSCQQDDLEESLQKSLNQNSYLDNFMVNVTVNERSCSVKKHSTLTVPDQIFLTVVFTFVLLCLIATFYNYTTRIENLEHYRFKGKFHQIILTFSFPANLQKISGKTKDNDGLKCIHGLRVISMFLIIMGHRIMFVMGSPILNADYVETFYTKITAAVLLNGPIIVDTFFTISGFLGCYLLITELGKYKKKSVYPLLYLHRFIRLTPTYAIVLAFYCTIFVKFGSGPFWNERVAVEQERCIESWWTNLLYINNYVNRDRICMFQSWYLTCDMHLFLITPLIVLFLSKKTRLAFATLISIIIFSICLVFTIVYIKKEDAILILNMKLMRDPIKNNTFQNVYIPTHMRLTPYLIGMIAGYIKYYMKMNAKKIPKICVYICWVTSTAIMLLTVYFGFYFYLPDVNYDPFLSGFYAALHHFTWSIFIGWIIIAISEGHGDWIKPVLCWKPLALLSRITYTAFLCHGAIQMYTAAISRAPVYIEIFILVLQAFGDITAAYIAGFILTMFFESPLIGLEKLIFNHDKLKIEKTENVPKIITVERL